MEDLEFPTPSVVPWMEWVVGRPDLLEFEEQAKRATDSGRRRLGPKVTEERGVALASHHSTGPSSAAGNRLQIVYERGI